MNPMFPRLILSFFLEQASRLARIFRGTWGVEPTNQAFIALLQGRLSGVRYIALFLLLLSPLPLAAGWNPMADDSPEEKKVLVQESAATLARFKSADPGLKIFFEKAYGYAVFPTVGKGGMGIGGAYGKGEVYRKEQLIGHATLTQVTIGFQLGGQAYSEIIFFKDKATLDDFRKGNFELNAQASAIAATLGASANVDYSNGVAIFTLAKGGLMYEASVGGQKFSFSPLVK